MEPHDREIAKAKGMKRCPDCAEFVQPDAKICRFCRHEFSDEQNSAVDAKSLSKAGKPTSAIGDETVRRLRIAAAVRQGTIVQDSASGTPRVIGATPSHGLLSTVLLWGVGLLILLALVVAIIGHLHSPSTPPSAMSSSEQSLKQASASDYASGRNIANAQLLALPASEQAGALAKAVGEGCSGIQAFYMGSSKQDEAFWSVKCSNSKSYAVMISPDSVGSTRVLECAVFRAVNAGECFTKLRD